MTKTSTRPLIDLVRVLLPSSRCKAMHFDLTIGTPAGTVTLPASFYGPMNNSTVVTSCTFGGAKAANVSVSGTPPFAYWYAYFPNAPTGKQDLVVQGNDGTSDRRTYTVNKPVPGPVGPLRPGFEKPRVALELVFRGHGHSAAPRIKTVRHSVTYFGPLRRGADGHPLPLPLWVGPGTDLEVGGPLPPEIRAVKCTLGKVRAKPQKTAPGRWLTVLTAVTPGKYELCVSSDDGAVEVVPLHLG